MTLTSAGLTDTGMGPGLTANFHVQYDTALPNQQRVIANANALISVLEREFIVTTGWFNTPGGKFGATNRQVVNLKLSSGSGADNRGYGSPIDLDGQDNNSNSADAAERVKMLWMNEWVEILMSLTGGRWNAGNSSGEGISQYSGIVRFRTGHYSYYQSFVAQWLDNKPRQDFVNSTEETDRNPVSFGCALAFIFYLTSQLGFSINQVIGAGAPTLAKTHQTLTNDSERRFLNFAALLEAKFPSSKAASITDDNPFPLPSPASLSVGRYRDKHMPGTKSLKNLLNGAANVRPVLNSDRPTSLR
jgi:hypothetical protein